MPILDRLGKYKLVQINSGRMDLALGPDDRGLKTGLDKRIKYLCCEIAINPVTRNPMHPDKSETLRAYSERSGATG